MEIAPRPRKSNFDFGAAVSQLFTTPGGAGWALKLILSTGAVLGLCYVLGMYLIATPYLGFVENMDQLDTNPEAVLSGFGAMAPGYLLMTFGALLTLVMGETALHCAVLRQEDTPGIPLRFGRDELRVFGASLGVWVFAFVAFFVIVLIGGLFGAALTTVVPELGVAIVIIAYLVGTIAWPFFAVRLSPAAALTVYNEKAHLLAGRHISKDRFWSLFLAFLAVGFGGYIVNSIISMIGMTALIGDSSVFLASGGELGSGSGKDIASTLREKFSNPLIVILAIIGAFIYSCAVATWLLTMAGIGTYAVKWWADDDAASPFD
ncbi:hypothetical protein ACJ3XI_04445 [Litorimonas sp. RW-G-Af-16]|uniref:hypothetical protein n=1 Tax=Litorimonas sp. RW-G-Af-16 TaxID=3241168 RepID=UPI00390C8E1C